MRISRLVPCSATVFLSASLSPILAQGDFDYDATSPATFGKTLNLDYKGAPGGKPLMFMLSLSGGPTPLKLMFGGSDPRSIQLGLDLLPAWLLISTATSGDGTIPVKVPTSPTIAGTHIHLQMMTGGGAGPNIVDKISNKIVIVPGARYSTSNLVARLGDGRNPRGPGRAMMSVFPISNTKGKIMLAGGGTGTLLGATGLKTTEIFDSRTNTISAGPNMSISRALASCTVLKDGRVLLAGGVDANGNPTTNCEIYNPTTNSFTTTGSMGTARAVHAAALLNDGRVLVAGGGEIYKFIGIPTRVQSVTTCQLFNPSSGSWSSTGSLNTSRAGHTLNTIRMNDGRVLVTGGYNIRIGLIPPPTNFSGAKAIKSCEIYNPSGGSWQTTPDMAVNRAGHTVTQMSKGMIIIAGGASGTMDGPVSEQSVQEYNPSSNSFVRTYNMQTARSTHGAVLTPAGSVILFGGYVDKPNPTTMSSIEIIHR